MSTTPLPASKLMVGSIELPNRLFVAPMAGVTDRPFRQLCRQLGAGLAVSEMVTSRALVERTEESLRIIAHDPGEDVRSVQLYGVDPHYVGEAVKRLVGEGHVDHIDMNFGCPAAKVTRRGGGAAVPAKPKLLRAIVRAAVNAAQPAG